MKKQTIPSLLALTLIALLPSFAQAASTGPALVCRSLGVGMWVGAMAQVRDVKAVGICRDQKDGTLYAMVQQRGSLGIGVGVGVELAFAKERIVLRSPVRFGAVYWNADQYHDARGVALGFSLSASDCQRSGRPNCERAETSVGVGGGGYENVVPEGTPAAGIYFLMKLSPGQREAPRPVEQPEEQEDSSGTPLDAR